MRHEATIARAPASAWYALAVLVATTLFAFVDRQLLNLIAPKLQKAMALSDFQLGALQGLGFALFASASAYPIGWLADRFGRLRILGCCATLWSVSTGACAFQNGFSGLLAANVGIAIGEAALTPIIFSLIPDLFPERQRNAANFTFFAASLLGAAAGFGFGGGLLAWLSDHQQQLPGALPAMESWRVALILAASPGPIFLALLATVRVRGQSERVVRADAPHSAPLQLFPFLRDHWPAFACLYGTMAAYGLALNCSFSWMPVAIPRVFGTASSTVGVQMGIAIGISTLIGLLLPPIGSRLLSGEASLKSLRLGRAQMAVAIAPTLFMLAASSPWQVYTAAGVQMALGLATAALMPGLIQQISPPQFRSRLLALLGVCTAVTQGAAPVLVGSVSDLLGGDRGILIAIVMVALPGWAAATLLLSIARRPFLATTAAIGSGEPA